MPKPQINIKNIEEIFGKAVTISPEKWPGKKLRIQPGDLSKFTPHGNGVYGLQRRNLNPFKNAPSQDAEGGVIYFDNSVEEEDFDSLLNMLGVRKDERKYAVFMKESKNPGQDGYLLQARVISDFGLRFLFGAIDSQEYDSFKEQKLRLDTFFHMFMLKECERWGTSFSQDGEKGLAGKFGGDGNYAKEELSFGFMVENSYHHVYRIWSRAWLVTK